MRETERLARFLAGELSADEAAALEREAAADPALAARLRAARAAWAGASAEDGVSTDVDAAWRRFALSAAELDRSAARGPVSSAPRDVLPLQREPVAATRTSRAPVRRRLALTPFRVAAATLLVLGAALLWRVTQSGQSVATAAGEQRVLTLADGSEVRLAPASRLIVPAGYGERHRTVELDGEAFFRTAHADAPPFIVDTRTARVRDIGTAFLVRALAADGSVDVVVTDGSVWLGRAGAPAGEGMRLDAGQHGRLDGRSDTAQSLGAADTVTALAWTRGRLVFDDAPLTEVALQLRRWYGVEVRIAAPRLAERRLSAEFEGEPVQEVLAVIARSLDIAVRRDGDDIVFDAR